MKPTPAVASAAAERAALVAARTALMKARAEAETLRKEILMHREVVDDPAVWECRKARVVRQQLLQVGVAMRFRMDNVDEALALIDARLRQSV